MMELLRQIEITEQELNKVQEQAEYWLADEHYDEEKSEQIVKHSWTAPEDCMPGWE